MDWETLLAISGIYILLLGIFFHHYLVSKRMMEINQKIHETQQTIRKTLDAIKAIETYILEGVIKKDK